MLIVTASKSFNMHDAQNANNSVDAYKNYGEIGFELANKQKKK